MTSNVLGIEMERRRPRWGRWLAYSVLLAGAGWTAFVEITFLPGPVQGMWILLFLALVPYAPYLLMAFVVRYVASSPSPLARWMALLGAVLVSGSSAAVLHVAFASGLRPWSGLAFVLAPPAQVASVLVLALFAFLSHRKRMPRMPGMPGRDG